MSPAGPWPLSTRPHEGNAGSVCTVAGQMWRVVSVYRVITLAYAALLIVRDDGAYAHPAAGYAALAIMASWTGVTVVAYRRPEGRTAWIIVADLCVAAALVLSTRWIYTAAMIGAGAPTIPVVWAAAPVLACAVAGGPWTGLAGALLISAADFAERHTLLPASASDGTVLLLIAGGVGGWVVRLGLRAERAIERAARLDAAVSERERIARDIHDSVLQVLALVSSRGRALGGEAAELGRLAGEQEAALRTLLATDVGPAAQLGAGMAEVRELIEPFGGARVTVSCPATPVPLPAAAASALVGAVGAALDNVRRHAGPDARAWVLVEDEGWQVRVSVRDDGKGFSRERLAAAAAEGRLGVSHSIVGRLYEAGGTACVTSSPKQGTEVELRVARH
jgi:signal transduction histidine kinase